MGKRINMVIGKKQIILVALALVLGIAIYLQVIFAGSGEPLQATGALEGESSYGDALFVSSGAVNDVGNLDEYFAQAKIDKMKTRDEAVETLQTLLGGGDLTQDELAVVAQDAVSLSKFIDAEGEIETLMKAQGFEDCIVYLDGKAANIIVKTPGLAPSEAAQIKDILLSKVTLDNENITILEVN